MNQEPSQEPDEQLTPPFAFGLQGRYMAALSVLPLVALGFVGLCLVIFILIWLLVSDFVTAFNIVFLPYAVVAFLLLPLLLVFLYMIRWHGSRRLEVHEEGLVFQHPSGEETFVHWGGLVAVELRFAVPRVVQCTLIGPGIRFSFSNLELNLEERQPMNLVFERGFEFDRIRMLLMAISRMAPKVRWRLSTPFQERFQIYFPPKDLERLR